MGLLPVKNYPLAKALKKANHADQRIPVGMDKAHWDAILKQRLIDAYVSNAMWAGYQVARWVETRRRIGVGYADALELLNDERLMGERLDEFAVHAALRPFAIRRARALVLSGKLQPRREQAHV